VSTEFLSGSQHHIFPQIDPENTLNICPQQF